MLFLGVYKMNLKKTYPLSLVVITLNEESNIERCLKSVPFAAEWIVVDSFSTDKTVEIAQKLGAKVVQEKWRGFGPQKAFAASLAQNPWVLSLDADEALSPELAQEIQEQWDQLDPQVGYQIPRRSFHLGRWINFGGWYPDSQLRLFNSASAQWDTSVLHEKVVVAQQKRLKNDIHHWVFKSLSDQVNTNNKYSGLGTQALIEKNKKFSLPFLLFKPLGKFFETYFLKLGFLDGMPGFIISVGASYSMFLKYAKLWEHELNQKKETSNSSSHSVKNLLLMMCFLMGTLLAQPVFSQDKEIKKEAEPQKVAEVKHEVPEKSEMVDKKESLKKELSEKTESSKEVLGKDVAELSPEKSSTKKTQESKKTSSSSKIPYPYISTMVGKVQVSQGEAQLNEKAAFVTIKDNTDIVTANQSSVRLEMGEGTYLFVAPESKVNIFVGSWDSGGAKPIILYKGIVRIVRVRDAGVEDPKVEKFMVRTPLAEGTFEFGDGVFRMDHELGRSEIFVLRGEFEFGGLGRDEHIELKKNQKNYFQGIIEDGELSYDVLLKSKKIARGSVKKTQEMTEQEKQVFENEVKPPPMVKEKPKIERKPSQICSPPYAEYNQCVLRCEGNPKSESSKCRTDLKSVSCVRYQCNANGKWSNKTKLLGGDRFKCKSVHDRLVSCEN
jgi:glycosyltransferase involved in cell wall biosynthesis